jgi:hypothetical protein
MSVGKHIEIYRGYLCEEHILLESIPIKRIRKKEKGDFIGI